jgi:hypothetical protein
MIFAVGAPVEEVVMARVEAVAGYGVLVLAVAMLAAFTMRLAIPPAEIMRAADAPHVMMLHPELTISPGASR